MDNNLIPIVNNLIPIVNNAVKSLSKSASTIIYKFNDGPVSRMRVKKFKNGAINIHINPR